MRKILSMLFVASLALSAAARAQESKAETSPLLDAKSPEMNQTAPEKFRAKFETSEGEFVIEVHRDWAPLGADRFYNLVANGFYDECRFFRVISGFMAQFGISGDPKIAGVWRAARIQDDPVKESNKRAYVSYAMGGPNSRTTQLFINYGDNSRLDAMGFPPFGKVAEGMSVVDKLYAEYGEGAPRGKGPAQGEIQGRGNEYLNADFPKLDFIRKATIVEDGK